MAGAREGKPDYLDVLVVAAAPVDLRPALNLGVELARLEDMVRRSAIPIRMRRVFPPTYAQLEKELSTPELERRNREPRVLHFLGHGEMDGLWFEREDGSGERISTNRIVSLLKGSPVKLALLNACWSATDLVASLCDRLTKEGGIPAAIGHGNPVADVSAIAFAREFYRQVVLGKSVGAAKNLAANALAEQGQPGATEVELKGIGMLLLADDLAEGERAGRVEDGMSPKGSLPGAAFFAGRPDEFTEVAATLDDTAGVDDPNEQAIDRGLKQLERAGLMEFEQDRGLYTFHQTLLDHVARQPAMDHDRARSSILALLAFHARYVADHWGHDAAIDRCVENILSTLEIVWGLREEESRLDLSICFVVDRLGGYFERRGLWRLGERWLECAIALRRSSTPARAQAALSLELHQLAIILYRRGAHAEARGLLHESIAASEELGDRRGRAASLHQLAMIEHAQGNPAEARRLLRESIAACEELGDRLGRAASLHVLAMIEHDQGNPAEARGLLRKSIAAKEGLGDRRGRATSLHQLAIIERAQGNPAEARRLWGESIEMSKEIGNLDGIATTLVWLARLDAEEGQFEDAVAQSREAVRLLEGIGSFKAARAREILRKIEAMAAGGPDV